MEAATCGETSSAASAATVVDVDPSFVVLAPLGDGAQAERVIIAANEPMSINSFFVITLLL